MTFHKGHKGYPAPKGNTFAVKHSLNVYCRMLSGGSRLDERTALHKVLREKEQELITALGGDPSPQERIIIADAIKTQLYVATIDEYLIKLDGGIIKQGKVIPVVDTRTKLASHLRENLRAIGLHRRVKTASLTEILSQHDEPEKESE
jgi:hypothetical protein